MGIGKPKQSLNGLLINSAKYADGSVSCRSPTSFTFHGYPLCGDAARMACVSAFNRGSSGASVSTPEAALPRAKRCCSSRTVVPLVTTTTLELPASKSRRRFIGGFYFLRIFMSVCKDGYNNKNVSSNKSCVLLVFFSEDLWWSFDCKYGERKCFL